MSKTRVLIVDDHPILVEGLRVLLSSQADIEVVGQAQDGEEAVAQVARLRPDIVIMDIGMPKMNGIEATRVIRRQHPETRVLILTQHEDNEYVLPLLKAGAAGIVLKRALVADLITALRVVMQGDTFLYPAVATTVVESIGQRNAADDAADLLTAREQQVLQHIVMGKTNAQIAVELSISIKTVEFHRANIMGKLGVHSVADLVRDALMRGLVDVGD